jgi:hypothetical protein
MAETQEPQSFILDEKDKSTSDDAGTPPAYAEQPPVLSTYIKPQGRKIHDSAVEFEEYHYYAQRTREEQRTLESPILNWREVVLRKKNAADTELPDAATQTQLTEANFAHRSNRLEISDEEWTNASRAFRTASWGACE